jgi:hypothetical protein
MYEEAVLDECAIQEIALRLDDASLTARELAERMSAPAYRVLRHLADMRRMGLVDMERGSGDEPVWTGSAAAADGGTGTDERST